MAPAASSGLALVIALILACGTGSPLRPDQGTGSWQIVWANSLEITAWCAC